MKNAIIIVGGLVAAPVRGRGAMLPGDQALPEDPVDVRCTGSG